MPKRYRVLELSYINGNLCPKGTIVQLEIDNPGSNLELAGEEPAGAGGDVELVAPYKIKHVGGGNFAVVDANGLQVGETFKKDADDAAAAKVAAQLVADKLNGLGGSAEGSGLPDA